MLLHKFFLDLKFIKYYYIKFVTWQNTVRKVMKYDTKKHKKEKEPRWCYTDMYDHCTHVFCSVSHVSGTLKEFKLLHAACSSMSVPKQWTNQKTPEAGQALQAFVYSSRLT